MAEPILRQRSRMRFPTVPGPERKIDQSQLDHWARATSSLVSGQASIIAFRSEDGWELLGSHGCESPAELLSRLEKNGRLSPLRRGSATAWSDTTDDQARFPTDAPAAGFCLPIPGSDGSCAGLIGVFRMEPHVWAERERESVREIAVALGVHFGRYPSPPTTTSATAPLPVDETHFRVLAEQSPVGACIVTSGQIHYANPRLAEMFGYSREELNGVREINDLFAELLTSRLTSHAQQKQFDGAVTRQVVRRDGSAVELEVHSTLMDRDGEPVLVATILDATARRKAEQANREREESFSLVMRATGNVVWDWDIEGSRMSWSEALCSIFGYRADEISESDTWWYERIHPDDRRHVTASLDMVLHQEGQLWTTEYRFRRGSGSYATVLGRGYVTRSEEGLPVRVMGAMTDISDHRQLEERFYLSQRMEAIGRLAGGVAHDFNNVLMVIRGTTDLLLADPSLAVQQRADVLEIRKSADRASALTRQLLAFGRRQVLRPEVIGLNALIAEMQGMLRRILGEDVELFTDLAGDLGQVRVDPRQFEHVVLNLVANARDAMPQGGRIEIRTSNVHLTNEDVAAFTYPMVPGPYVRVAVQDSGSGMDEHTLSQIFEPFFTTKGQGKGTGLGLSTVYGIVKQSGGYIWASCSAPKGTTFEIFLPRTSRKPVTSRPAIRKPGKIPKGAGTILLVEDEDSVRSVTRRILAHGGYTVLEAPNGVEALRICDGQEEKIDLLLTDVVMPDIGGNELAERAASVIPGLRVIYMSGHTDDRILRYGIGREDVNFIQKPFDPESLLRRVRALLNDVPGETGVEGA